MNQVGLKLQQVAGTQGGLNFGEIILLKNIQVAAAKSLQSCPTLCDPIDGSPPGSPVPGILQARTLEWVAISFSNAWKGKVKVKSLSRVRPSATPWTAPFQAPPSMGFSRQEYWSGVPLPLLTCIIFTYLFSWRIYLVSNLLNYTPMRHQFINYTAVFVFSSLCLHLTFPSKILFSKVTWASSIFPHSLQWHYVIHL